MADKICLVLHRKSTTRPEVKAAVDHVKSLGHKLRVRVAWNKKDNLDRVVFEGAVDDHLVVEFFGEELDTFSANDELDHYQREFRGPVEEWVGRYAPGEDLPEDTPSDDPESMTNWRICYYIERA